MTQKPVHSFHVLPALQCCGLGHLHRHAFCHRCPQGSAQLEMQEIKGMHLAMCGAHLQQVPHDDRV